MGNGSVSTDMYISPERISVMCSFSQAIPKTHTFWFAAAWNSMWISWLGRKCMGYLELSPVMSGSILYNVFVHAPQHFQWYLFYYVLITFCALGDVTWRNIMLRYISLTSRHVTLRHVMLCYALLRCVKIFFCVMSYSHTTLHISTNVNVLHNVLFQWHYFCYHCSLLRCVTQYHAELHFVTLSYVTVK